MQRQSQQPLAHINNKNKQKQKLRVKPSQKENALMLEILVLDDNLGILVIQYKSNHIKLYIMSKGEFNPGLTSLASGFFCWLADIILYPIDTVSTRLKGNKQKLNMSTPKYLWQSFKREGWSLYRGVSLTLPHSFIPTALYIYIYEILMHKTSQLVDRFTDKKQVKLIFPFFLSAFAECFALAFELPFDTVRTRIQMNTEQYQYSSAFTGLKEIKEKEGILRFYLSTRIYFATKTLYTAVQFQTYEMLNYYNGHVSYSIFINSILSAVVATSILNPLEVLITRYALVDTTKKKLVFSYMVQRIMQREGVAGFYKGYITQVLLRSFYSVMWLPIFQLMRDKYGLNLTE